MPIVSAFEHLSDLSLLEVFSYLSNEDALWSFGNLNTRLIVLLTEQGVFRHVNLSSIRYNQFREALSLLRLNEIQSLTIDYHASTICLSKWPNLPNLMTLKIRSVRNLTDVFKFTTKHADTLAHLTVQSNEYHISSSPSKNLIYPAWNLCDFTKRLFSRMSVLHSLDFGMETSFHLHLWPVQTLTLSLTYLRLTLGKTYDLMNILRNKPLSTTLQQLHVKISDTCRDIRHSLQDKDLLPSMTSLHTFTFVKSFKWHVRTEWIFVDVLTRPIVMPVIRRVNFSIVIDVDDLQYMRRSALFTDSRRVDVHYAFMINNDREHSELRECVPLGSRSHKRHLVSATFISEEWSYDPAMETPDFYYLEKPRNRQHFFYTLPWTFDEFPQFCVPDKDISELSVYSASSVDRIISSHLTKLNMANNLPSSITSLPHLVSRNQIVQLHLLHCDRQISFDFPFVNRLILTNSLDSLNSSSLSRNIRSIEIILYYERFCFANDDWTPLHTLSKLPFLESLRILLYDMRAPPRDTSCQIIGSVVSMISNFSFFFRRCIYRQLINNNLPYEKYSLFIQQLRDYILASRRNEEPRVVVTEKNGCGLIVWF